jgi:hypothetical protein
MIKTALDGVERTDAEQVVVGMYLGYVAGFMDSNEVEFKKEGIVLDNVFNTDPGSASGKLGVWLLSHPQYWDRSAHYCMSRAFIHAYLKN